MRATAEVDEVSLTVEREILVTGNGFDNLDFVFFTHLLEHGDSIAAIHDGTLDGEVFFNDVSHNFLDRLQIFGSKRAGEGEIVEEPIFNDWPYSNLSLWKQTLHGLGH